MRSVRAAKDLMPQTRACRECGKLVVWIQLVETARWMPCDPRPAWLVSGDGRKLEGYRPHWGSCPGADKVKRNHKTASTQMEL
jgi:hypothetical protein